MKKILIVDDDPTTHTVVKGVLINDFNVISCLNISDACAELDKTPPPDLVILDRMLPDGDGLSICTKMRADERLNAIPLIFLSAKLTESDKISGLYAGADDYMIKPFSPSELKARVQARFRMETKKIFIENLVIDINAHRAYIKNTENGAQNEIDLTRLEFKLLITLAQSQERLFSREYLINKVWGSATNINDRVVDTHLSHLRKKISQSGVKIEAIRGEGYRLLLKSKKNQAA